MKKTITISFLSFFFLLSLFLIFLTRFFINFSYSINHRPQELIAKLTSSYQQSKTLPQNLNFLILGLDERNDWLEKTSVTDTIIFVSINLSKQKVHLISLPRDLWIEELGFKINNIYPHAKETQQDYYSFIKKEFSKLINQEINGIVIIKTDSLIQIPQLVGPLDIYLENAFKDDQYPSPCYIENPKICPNPYMTINFDQGWNKLDQSNITPFIRSRKANGNNDQSRSHRQQLLIEALLNKLKNKDTVFKHTNISKFYNFWHQQIDSNIADEILLSIFMKFKKQILNLQLEKHEIPVGLNKFDESGVIYHPDYFINKAWVFLPSQGNITNLQLFISQSIE
ncbi:LCP family protein [Patescibacteria group bacterium]|nr:LCP family protein [Patescibacteria group bacterium]